MGISCYYHDSAASLIKDGQIIAAAEEERFTRKKHDNSFPSNAIQFCLNFAGIRPDDLSAVGFYEKPFLKFERLLYQYIESFPWSVRSFLNSVPGWITERLRVPKIIRKQVGYKGSIYFVPHHISHAAASFLVSPFQKAAIVTADGVGEWTTTAYGYGIGSEITLEKEIKFPHSIGLLYSTITAYLGFSVNNSEYKIMGLAAYGQMNKEKNEFYKKLKEIIDIKSDGSYHLNMDYFLFHKKERMPSPLLCELLGGPIRKNEEISIRHKDIAAALQLITEEVMMLIINQAYKKRPCENLVLAGGVALNSVCNGKILKNTPFKRMWIQPNASDGGNSVGAAAYVYHTLLGHKRECVMNHAYLGPECSEEQVYAFLAKNNINFSKFGSERELIVSTAQMINDNKVVGWFQGRMEFGPRALGARSILSNPCNPEMKEILNVRVKHRESFRPFAPVVCKEDVETYFDVDLPLPEPADFMLMVYPIKEKFREYLPAVTHVDGSGRLQTLSREQNPLYYDLIKECSKKTGFPMLINTSFNIRGEPIVCTPEDAYRCMMGTGIDCLIIGLFLVRREDNLKDVWDSERYAKD